MRETPSRPRAGRVLARVREHPVAAVLAILTASVLLAYFVHHWLHSASNAISVWEARRSIAFPDSPRFFEIWQAFALVLGVVGAVGAIIDKERASYTEANKRYENFSLLLLKEDAPLLGFGLSDLERFEAAGGSKRELLLYDVLFSLCEYAHALYGKRPAEWARWEDWLQNFFDNHGRATEAWYITSRYYEAAFRARVERALVIPAADARSRRRFPSEEEWVTASPQNHGLEIREDPRGEELLIHGFQVMQHWEDPYMKALASAVTKPGGVVLEVGYGLGIAAKHVQALSPRIHVIVEANEHLARRAKRDLADQIARGAVIVYRGFWEDLVPMAPWRQDADISAFDGILFDTYPLKRDELRRNHFPFFRAAKELLAPEGVFTYYSDEVCTMSPQHQEAIREAFPDHEVAYRQQAVAPWDDCEYWRKDQILLITIRRGISTTPRPARLQA